MKCTYRKSGATVNVHQDGDVQIYEITRNDKKLDMTFKRQQEIKDIRTAGNNYTTPLHKCASCFVSYDIGVKIGDAENKYTVSYKKELSEMREKDLNYDSSFEKKGIPTEEHKIISKALEEQNTAVAHVFSNYVLNAEDLQKENDLSQSIFNQKLDDFLNG